MKKFHLVKGLLLALCLCLTASTFAQRQMENLSRGVVAIRQADGVFVSWRLLGTEPMDLGFNVYRQTGSQKAVKLKMRRLLNMLDADLKKYSIYGEFGYPVNHHETFQNTQDAPAYIFG